MSKMEICGKKKNINKKMHKSRCGDNTIDMSTIDALCCKVLHWLWISQLSEEMRKIHTFDHLCIWFHIYIHLCGEHHAKSTKIVKTCQPIIIFRMDWYWDKNRECSDYYGNTVKYEYFCTAGARVLTKKSLRQAFLSSQPQNALQSSSTYNSSRGVK